MDGDEAFGWVSLNFEKGRLVVEASSALQKPAIESNDPVDLVAAADGILLEVNAQEGFAVKSVGQTVAAGDVLGERLQARPIRAAGGKPRQRAGGGGGEKDLPVRAAFHL